jgi:hypothetical protein
MYKYVMSFNDNPIEFPEFLGFTGLIAVGLAAMLLIMHVSIFDTAVILYSLKLFICNVLLTDASCKWSNEGCTTNNECCSGSRHEQGHNNLLMIDSHSSSQNNIYF